MAEDKGFKRLDGKDIEFYKRKYIGLPPQPNNILRIRQALEAGIPVEYFVSQGVVTLDILGELNIGEDLERRFVECFRFFGMLPEDEGVDEYIRELGEKEDRLRQKGLEQKLEVRVDSEEVKKLELIIAELREDIGRLEGALVEKERVIGDKSAQVRVLEDKVRLLEGQIEKVVEDSKEIALEKRTALSKYSEMKANIDAYEGLLKEKNRQIELKDLEIETMKNKIENIDKMLKDREESVRKECTERLEEYKRLMTEYEHMYSGGVVEKVDTGINVDLELKKARLEGKKIVGLYGRTLGYIKDGLGEIEGVYVAFRPDDVDIRVFIANPVKDSVLELKDFVKEYPDCIKVMNMWDKRAPFKAWNMCGVRFDLVIDYDEEEYVRGWLGCEGERDWVCDLKKLIELRG